MHLPKIRNHESFLKETSGSQILSDKVLVQWDEEQHSVSRHLQLMYSIAKGMGAKRIVEIGFGRSSKVFARVAHENEGIFYSCDRKDCSYLYSSTELESIEYVHGSSDDLWRILQASDKQIDFAFLGYFLRRKWKLSTEF